MKTFEVTKLSSKGQVVIPTEIREKMGLLEGTQLMVVSDGSNLLLKPLEAPKMEMFKDLVKESRKIAKSLQLKKSDISKAIKKVRDKHRS